MVGDGNYDEGISGKQKGREGERERGGYISGSNTEVESSGHGGAGVQR